MVSDRERPLQVRAIKNPREELLKKIEKTEFSETEKVLLGLMMTRKALNGLQARRMTASASFFYKQNRQPTHYKYTTTVDNPHNVAFEKVMNLFTTQIDSVAQQLGITPQRTEELFTWLVDNETTV